MNIIWVEFNSRRSKILFKARQLRCARYRNDPRLLRKEPGECDLGRSYFPLRCKRTHQINQSLVRFAILRAETRHAAAEIGAIELCVRVDLASQEAFAQRAERNEANSKLLQRGHHRLFRLAPEQRVLALKCSDGLNCMGPANRLYARFRKTEVLHLAFLNQILHSARNIFDRYIHVDPMLIEEINSIDLEALGSFNTSSSVPRIDRYE